MKDNFDFSKIKVVVFDIGGTLIDFINMPFNWSDFYYQAFVDVNNHFQLNLSESDINQSVNILTQFNPRLSNREIEIPPEDIFAECTQHWKANFDLQVLITAFFDSFNLSVQIFSYSIPLICQVKNMGKIVCLLTDLPNGMPDTYFRNYITDIINSSDFYISSQSCGHRKPNPYALNLIADKYCVKKNEILYIGDELKDKLTAERFGCKFIYIDNFNAF